MGLKAVLFDMDGVIVNTEPLHRKAYYRMFEDFSIDVSSELYASYTGNSTRTICDDLIQRFNLDRSASDLVKVKRNYFKDFFDNDPDFDLIEGVLDLIKHYHKNGIKLVLASSASMDTINLVFDKFDLDRYFIGKISGADLEESKPNPEIFVRASEIANESRSSCMVIEDSTNGIMAAYRASIFCAAYKSENSKMQDYTKASILVDDYSNLFIDKVKSYFE